jgi:hypothetical protein
MPAIEFMLSYLALGMMTYIISPILYKDWGWGLYDGSVPPPELTSAAWPIIVIYYAAILTYKIVSSPFTAAKYLHNKVAEIVRKK